MKLSFDWLNDFVDLKSISLETIREKINTSICEIDDIAPIESDFIFTIDNKSITHRPDLWCHFGFAKELAAQLNIKIHFSPYNEQFPFSFQSEFEAKINNQVHSYYISEVKGVNVTISEKKISSRLEKCGLKTLNNIVDISNYVLLEMGQPTHFFDSGSLKSNQVLVDFAKNKVDFQLLDASVVKLLGEDLVIQNDSNLLAVAGVMGGFSSMVSANTKGLVLESAIFPREKIRKTSKRLGIRSESSIRYEKGLNPKTALPVINRILVLLKKSNPNMTASFPVGSSNFLDKEMIIQTDLDFINRKLGKNLTIDEVKNVLTRLYFEVHEKERGILDVVVPESRRQYDVTMEEDLVEEIGRTIQYKSIPIRPVLAEIKSPKKNLGRELERIVKNYFVNTLKLNEVFNYSFGTGKDKDFGVTEENSIAILNEMPEESKYLRSSIYPALLKNLIANQDRFDEVRIFELAKTYLKIESEIDEKKWFVFLNAIPLSKNTTDLEKEILIFRSGLERLLWDLKIKNFQWLKKHNKEYFHPNGAIEFNIEGDSIGELGILHPSIQKKYGIKKSVFIGKIHFEKLLKNYINNRRNFHFTTPNIFPENYLDISILTDKNTATEIIKNQLEELKISEIKKIWVFDIFQGGNLSSNQQSVTFRILLSNPQETISGERIKMITESLISHVQKSGYSLRT